MSTNTLVRNSVDSTGSPRLAAAAVAVSLSSWLLLALATTELAQGHPARIALTLAVIFTVPGLPAMALLRLPSVPISVAAAIAVSWSTWVLIALTMILTRTWLPELALCAVALVSTAMTIRLLTHVRPRWGDSPGALATRSRIIGLLFAATGCLLVLWEAQVIDIDAVDARGLISAVSWRIPIALILAAAVFVWAVTRRRPDSFLVAAALLTPLLANYQLVNIADGSAVVRTGYIHVGFAEYIGTHHQLPPSVDARFSWSGFFNTLALIVDFAGLTNASALMLWAPAAMVALVALPTFLCALLLSGNRRIALVAMGIALCWNWFQQDYLSPQAIALVLHMTIMTITLWLLRQSDVPAVAGSRFSQLRQTPFRVPGSPRQLSRRQHLAIAAVIVLIGSALIVSHQMTPGATIAALFALAIAGRLRLRELPVILLIIFIAWLSYGAPDYWTGHLQTLLADVGNIGNSFRGGVGDRVGAVPDYQQMQRLRMLFTASLAAMAVAGLWFMRRRKMFWPAAALLVTPFLLIGAQSYGGEVVLRTTYYALPIMATLAAVAVYQVAVRMVRRLATARWQRGLLGIAAVVLCTVVALTGLASRGLNTSFERNPANVVAMARNLLETVPTGTSVAPMTEGVLKMGRITEVYWPHGFNCDLSMPQCQDTITADYLLVTRTFQKELELQWGAPENGLFALAQLLVDRGRYRIVETNEHAWLLKKVDND